VADVVKSCHGGFPPYPETCLKPMFRPEAGQDRIVQQAAGQLA